MTSQAWLSSVILATLELFLALALSVLASMSGMHVLDRLTQGIEEWKEIKKGNVSLGILVFAIVLAMAWIDESVVSRLLYSMQPGASPLLLVALFLGGLWNLVFATLLTIVAIYIAIRLFDTITVDIDEIAELKKGNVAMALVLAGIILAIAFVSKSAILQLIDTIGLESFIRARIF